MTVTPSAKFSKMFSNFRNGPAIRAHLSRPTSVQRVLFCQTCRLRIRVTVNINFGEKFQILMIKDTVYVSEKLNNSDDNE